MRTARFGAVFALASLAAAARAQEPGPPAALPRVLPFVEDDYAGALARARQKGLPLFVEAWAPWCHTCRSMRAFVFTDPSLRKRSAQFVWLSIDTEKKSNAPFLTKFPVEAWPTFLVVDPRSEKAALRFVGGATAAQLQRILDDGRRAVRGNEKGLDELLARADALYAEKQNAAAASLYRDAIAKAPKSWKSYPRAVESLLFALGKAGEDRSCAETARDAFPRLADSPSAPNVAGSGLDCALSLPAGEPSRPALVAELAADARRVLDRPKARLAADDVSSLYGVLARERKEAPDAEGHRRVLTDWAAFLEAEAARAKTPDARAVFDAHRLTVYIALGQPARAIPMLEASEEALPDDYNPSARLALAYEAMRDYDRALLASDRALSLAYGPRLISLLSVRSRIYQEHGDLVSARIALEEAIREAEALPEGQRSNSQIESLREKLGKLARE